MEKVLSILIPTYNMERYLDKCLSSLIVGDDVLSKLDVIVVNDGSKDNSSAIAHGYEEKYPNVFRVIDKENGNYGSCINRGLKEATGKYIRVLDADDSYYTDGLEKFILFLEKQNADLVFSNYDIVDPMGNITNSCQLNLPVGEEKKFVDICTQKEICSWQMHGITYRKAIFDNIDYHQTEGVSYTDQEWIFEPMTQVKTAINSGIKVYSYLMGREGQTMDVNVRKKTISQNMMVVTSRARIFSKYSNLDERMQQHLYWKISVDIKYIYISGLINNLVDKQCLTQFDEALKQNSPQIYSCSLATGGRLMFLIVTRWRERKSYKCLCFLYLLLHY